MLSRMSAKNLHQPYEFEIAKLTKRDESGRRNNFFELIYVLEGYGLEFVNGNNFSYKPGNLFLLTPQDEYSFEITEPTTFVFVRFNDAFLLSGTPSGDHAYHMAYILENASHQPGCILKNHPDKSVVRGLFERIIYEREAKQLFHERIVEQIINTLLTIVARNLSLRLPERFRSVEDKSVRDILFYIHQNIYEPDKLRTGRIAGEFGIGESYLGRYFKKHTAESLTEYINNYRLKLVETRLLHSSLRINQIAYELNFADESHLNKVFKKHFGENPSEYRRRKRGTPAASDW